MAMRFISLVLASLANPIGSALMLVLRTVRVRRISLPTQIDCAGRAVLRGGLHRGMPVFPAMAPAGRWRPRFRSWPWPGSAGDARPGGRDDADCSPRRDRGKMALPAERIPRRAHRTRANTPTWPDLGGLRAPTTFRACRPWCHRPRPAAPGIRGGHHRHHRDRDQVSATPRPIAARPRPTAPSRAARRRTSGWSTSRAALPGAR